MKFSVSKDKLLEGLSTVQNVVSTRTTLPILSNVLLQASDGEVRLTTTDLDVGVRGSIDERQRAREVAVVVGRGFGDEHRRANHAQLHNQA